MSKEEILKKVISNIQKNLLFLSNIKQGYKYKLVIENSSGLIQNDTSSTIGRAFHGLKHTKICYSDNFWPFYNILFYFRVSKEEELKKPIYNAGIGIYFLAESLYRNDTSKYSKLYEIASDFQYFTAGINEGFSEDMMQPKLRAIAPKTFSFTYEKYKLT
ncbi:hypothetical protein FRA_44c12030 [Francisella sp. W12-1067]|nr:hypothetical protein FRA_44c12030 [Francisella sp. W12-1067]